MIICVNSQAAIEAFGFHLITSKSGGVAWTLYIVYVDKTLGSAEFLNIDGKEKVDDLASKLYLRRTRILFQIGKSSLKFNKPKVVQHNWLGNYETITRELLKFDKRRVNIITGILTRHCCTDSFADKLGRPDQDYCRSHHGRNRYDIFYVSGLLFGIDIIGV